MDNLQAEINTIPLNHEFFKRINDYDIKELNYRLLNKTSLTVVFKENEREVFGMIVDINKNAIHIRELGGNFPKHLKTVYIFCLGLCNYYNKRKITLVSTRKAVDKLASNFKFIKANKEWELCFGR